jgi:hypothetical protein
VGWLPKVLDGFTGTPVLSGEPPGKAIIRNVHAGLQQDWGCDKNSMIFLELDLGYKFSLGQLPVRALLDASQLRLSPPCKS